MSRTRYYPVAQGFLNDAETWEMRDQFGDRAVFMWMSLLSAGEMDEGNIHGSPAYIARIHGQYLDRTHPERAQNLLVYLVNKRWLTPLYRKVERDLNETETPPLTKAEPPRIGDQKPLVYPPVMASYTPPLTEGLIVGYFITNYWKYHRKQRLVRESSEVQVKRSPILSYPSEPILDTKSISSECSFSVTDFVDSWNSYFKGKLPSVRLPLATSRQRKVQARLRDHPDLEFWKLVFAKVWNSKFLMGSNGNSNSQWKVSFDWIISNDTNVLKISEGNYDNKN